MQKEWKAFRITLLLYFSIFMISLSFYQVFMSFNEIQNDTKILHKTILINNNTKLFLLSKDSKEKQNIMNNTDRVITELKAWLAEQDFQQTNAKVFESFSQLLSCWDMSKKNQSCHDKMNLSSFSIEQAFEAKQNKMTNKLYINFFILIVIMLFLIYTVRAYIHMQMKKHAIYDHDTKLFNQKYFNTVLKTSAARAVRYKDPLSMLFIMISDFGKGDTSYDKKTKKHILETFSDLIRSTVRTSDIACRYDEDHFAIIVPDSEKHKTELLESRLRQALEGGNFGVSPKLKFDYATAQFDNEETAEAFTTRTQTLLK